MVGRKWDNRDLYDLVIAISIVFSSYEGGDEDYFGSGMQLEGSILKDPG
jgi:hypothetical protein